MASMSDPPLTLEQLAELLRHFHRQTALPDTERVVSVAERRLVDQVERLWDALLDTRERLETDYQTTKAALARVEHALEAVHVRLGAIEKRLAG
jgi:hypothetical protein